jgi:hypothetical protein
MEGELRVTVVATGLGAQARTHQVRSAIQQAQHPMRQQAGVAAVGATAPTQAGGVSYSGASGQSPYTPFDSRPAAGVVRKTVRPAPAAPGAPQPPAQPQQNSGNGGLEYLDIPAFLRRQAD